MPDIFVSIIVLGTFYLIIYKCRNKDKKVDQNIKENETLKFYL